MAVYGEYKITGQKLGSGAFGQIYSALNKRNEKVAIKIEKTTSRNPQLYFQAKILQLLDSQGKNNENGIIKVIEYFTEGDECLMVMKPLGSSLQYLFKQHGRQFPLKTIMMIGLQLLERIRYVHEQGFIHRDIKPDNFLIGKDDEANKIFLIDFGLAKKYQSNNTHIGYKDNKNLTGTARYASINTHLGVEQGRRDDLEGMMYMLVYFFKGQLPWQNMDARDKKEKYQKILQKKINIPLQHLCHSMPQPITDVLKYVRNLFFDEKPNYKFIKEAFLSVLSSNGLVDDGVFVWNSIETY